MTWEPTVPPKVASALAGAQRPVCAYVYDTATLRRTATALRAPLPDGVDLLYAVKANSHPAVVAALAACVDGLEVASGGELSLARSVLADVGGRRSPGMPDVVFGGPAKTDAELAAAVDAGALVHVESIHELRRLDLLARDAAIAVRVALRVNRLVHDSHQTLAGSHQMAGAATPFGIDETQVGDALRLAAGMPTIDLLGFHAHTVSNNLDAAAHGAHVAEFARWASQTARHAGLALRYVNAGGGLGVDYTGGAAFDVWALADGLRAARGALPADCRLVIEPGRHLAADAGWYAAEVLDLKRTHGRWFAVLRGGTHHFRLPAAWRYSHPFAVLPVERWDYPFARPAVRDVTVDAVGELCTPRDVLARDRYVTHLRVGDVLVFPRAGAYGWDISHHDFLRHPHPQMLVI